jgi:hypothetical protein
MNAFDASIHLVMKIFKETTPDADTFKEENIGSVSTTSDIS